MARSEIASLHSRRLRTCSKPRWPVAIVEAVAVIGARQRGARELRGRHVDAQLDEEIVHRGFDLERREATQARDADGVAELGGRALGGRTSARIGGVSDLTFARYEREDGDDPACGPRHGHVRAASP